LRLTSSKTNVGPDKDSDKRQLAAIEAYAKAAGLEIVATFSGADPVTDRPGLAEMLERLLSNGARTIVVAKRLGGAPIGAARCRNWLKAKNPDFRTIDFCAAAGLTPTLGVKLVHKVSRSGIVPIPVEHVHPGGMRRASHVYPTLEQRGLGASSVGLHFTNDVVQAVKKLHPVLHHRLVKSPPATENSTTLKLLKECAKTTRDHASHRFSRPRRVPPARGSHRLPALQSSRKLSARRPPGAARDCIRRLKRAGRQGRVGALIGLLAGAGVGQHAVDFASRYFDGFAEQGYLLLGLVGGVMGGIAVCL
jgi:hypothetical protein